MNNVILRFSTQQLEKNKETANFGNNLYNLQVKIQSLCLEIYPNDTSVTYHEKVNSEP